MPKKFTSDPGFEFGTSKEKERIIEIMRAEKGQSAIDKLTLLTRDLLIPFSKYGRGYVQAILQK